MKRLAYIFALISLSGMAQAPAFRPQAVLCYSLDGSGNVVPCNSASTGGIMVYPPAGVAVSTGTGWANSLVAPTGNLVGDTDTQTLSNKTFTGNTQADIVIANNFIGQLNSVAIGGTPVAGSVPVGIDSTHATWGNNSPTGTGFWFSTDGVRDATIHVIAPQDLPAIIGSNTTGNAGTSTALQTQPTVCQPVDGVTTYPTGIDTQGNATGCSSPTGSGQPGSVVSVTVNDIPTFVNATVATPSTTAVVSFSLIGAPAHSFWGNDTDTEDDMPGYSALTVDDLPESITGIQAHNTVWAAPDATNGTPSFRSLLQADVPFAAPLSNPSFTGNVFAAGGTTHNFSTPDGGYCFGAVSVSSTPIICLWSDNATNVHLGDATKSDPSNISLTAATFIGALQGNASTATTATTATTASSMPYSGLTGTVPTWNQNTTGNSATATSAVNLSGSITEAQVAGLGADLATKAPLASPALTGVPTAPTAASSTNTTQIATTAMVQAAIAAETPATEIFGQVSIAAGGQEGNDSSHSNISNSSVCVASPMNVISGTPNTNPWAFVINLSPSNISIVASNTMGQKQVYSYMCKP